MLQATEYWPHFVIRVLVALIVAPWPKIPILDIFLIIVLLISTVGLLLLTESARIPLIQLLIIAWFIIFI